MREFIVAIFLSLGLSGVAQNCDISPLDKEIYMTENIALVTTGEVRNDSVSVSVVKKWKGDSVPAHFMIKQEGILSKYFRLDSGKTYMLFWFHGFGVDRCSRTAEFKYTHFEYKLDELLKGGELINKSAYDSLTYAKANIFKTTSGQLFDRTKGNYAFYDVNAGELKEWDELPKETSYLFPLRYYIVDNNIKTASTTYDVVFAVDKSDVPLVIDNDLKKDAIKACYGQ